MKGPKLPVGIIYKKKVSKLRLASEIACGGRPVTHPVMRNEL